MRPALLSYLISFLILTPFSILNAQVSEDVIPELSTVQFINFDANEFNLSVDVGCVNPEQIDLTVACIEIYAPVCGCDGVTYSNECYAFNYGGVSSWTEGECAAGCINPDQINPTHPCPENYDPVCGCDGVTYSNECHAYYYGGVSTWIDGACVSDCINPDQIDPAMGCPDIWDPVCGCDGVTYGNDCDAFWHAGVTSWTDGPCVTGCIDESQIDPTVDCPDIWDPVCGCDGISYPNECYAYWHEGVTSWTDGPCASDCIDESQIDSSIICPLAFIPVCGCDGVTYNNVCEAIYYGGVTSWTDGVCCPAPTGLSSILAPSGIGVQLSWDAVPIADAYQLRGRKTSGLAYAKTITTNTFKNVGNLLPGMEYEWSVRARCLGTYISDWASTAYFGIPLAKKKIVPVSNLFVYPNPSNGEFYLELNEYPSEELNIRITDLLGKTIHEVKSTERVIQVNLDHISSGVYLILVNVGQNELIERLLIE